MNEPTIVLPRRWVQALLQKATYPFWICNHCNAEAIQVSIAPGYTQRYEHAPDCVVRLVQERLQETHKDT